MCILARYVWGQSCCTEEPQQAEQHKTWWGLGRAKAEAWPLHHGGLQHAGWGHQGLPPGWCRAGHEALTVLEAESFLIQTLKIHCQIPTGAVVMARVWFACCVSSGCYARPLWRWLRRWELGSEVQSSGCALNWEGTNTSFAWELGTEPVPHRSCGVRPCRLSEPDGMRVLSDPVRVWCPPASVWRRRVVSSNLSDSVVVNCNSERNWDVMFVTCSRWHAICGWTGNRVIKFWSSVVRMCMLMRSLGWKSHHHLGK